MGATGPASAMGARLASEGAAYTMVELAQQALGLAAIPVVFWYLTPGEFGIVTWALVVSQLGTTLASAGLDFSLLRHHYQLDAGSRARQQRHALGRAVLLATGFGALAIVAGRWSPPDERAPLLLGAAAGLILGVRSLPVASLRAEGRLRRYAAVQLGGTLCQVVVQIVLLMMGFGATGYMWGYVAGAAVVLPVALAGFGGGRGSPPQGQVDRTVSRYAWEVFPATLLNRVQLLADRALLTGWGGTEAVGLYGAALRLATPVKLLSGGLKTALAPALSRAEADAVNQDVAAAPLARLVMLTTLPLGSAAAIAGWCVQLTPWQPHWLAFQRALSVLLFAQILQSLAFVLQTLVYYSRSPRRAGWISGAQATTLIAALLVLVPLAGGQGAALAQLLAGLAAVGVAIIVLRRERAFEHVTAAAVWPALAFLPVVWVAWLDGSRLQLIALLTCLAAYTAMCGMAWRRLPAHVQESAPA